jgi:MSHA biogenesis protein MshJ
MPPRLLQLINRLEALTLRERIMALVGLPLLLIALAEMLWFSPTRAQAVEARKQTELKQAELKALSAVLAAQPAQVALPGADQLLKQRNEMLGHTEAARAILDGASQSINWGTVVRATVAGTPGLTLTQLKTTPPELLFSPAMLKPASAPTAGRAAPAAPATAKAPVPAASGVPQATDMAIYLHRADLSVKGDFGSLLGYLQTLQRVPGDLHWERLQLGASGYPQATVQLTLFTLSNRAETPFN